MTLLKINNNLGLSQNFFTFHSFRRPGATLAYTAHVSIQQIKNHGSWASDCVWTYIQRNHIAGEDIARSFANMVSKYALHLLVGF